MDDGRVVIRFQGDDSGLRRTLDSTKTSLSGLKSFILKLGIGAAVTKAFGEGVKAVNEFDAAVAKASTLFGDVAVDVDGLKGRILELSSATGQAASGIAESLYNALSAGVEVTEDMATSMDFLEANTKLAVAGFTDVDTAVTATAKVLNAYGMEVSEASRVHEVLMQTQNLGITTVGDLGSALATVTPIAASFGVEFEQVGASLAVMTKQGTDTARATTQLRGLISELGKDGTQASKNLQAAFKRAGLEYSSFADYMQKGGNLQEALRLMQEQAHESGVSLADMFGNIEGGVGALQIASDATEVYTQFLKGLESETSLVDDAYGKMMETRANSWKRMKEQLRNITIKVTGSDAAKKALDDLTDVAQGMLDRMDAWLPDALADLNAFYLQSKLIFSYLQGEYDRSFLKKGVDFVIKVVKDELDSLKKSFESGDLFGAALKLVGDLITIKVGFSLLQSLGSLVLSSFTDSFLTRNGALMLVGDALMVYFGFKQAQKDGDWKQFGSDLINAIIAGAIAAGVTGRPEAGLLVFGIAFNLADETQSMFDKLTEGVLEFFNTYAESLDKFNGFFGRETHYGDQIITPREAKAMEEEIKRQEAESLSIQNEIDGLKKSIEAKQKAYEDVFAYLETIGVIENKTIRKEDFDLIGNMMQRASKGVSPSDAYNDYIKAEKLYLQQVEDEMVSSAERTLTALRTELLSLWETDVGRNAILGIYGGFRKEDLENIGEKAAENLLAAVKERLDINSPSKEFEKIGEYCVQGLANGMTKSDAKNQLDTAFDTIYENMRQAVKEGSMTLEESFRELQTMLSLADAYTGRIGSFVPAPSKVRTTGGGGRNSMEGFSLDKDGRWVEAVKALEPSGWDNFWKAMALGADTGIERLFDLFEGMTVVEDGVERLTEKGQFWADSMNGAVTTMLSSFETLGQDLVEGELSWRSFANVGLEALASLLEALGYQLASMAISTYPNFAQMALSAAGSAAAFAFAGMVRGSKFESGGIVGGSGITGDRHMIFANAGELILNRTQQNALAGQLSTGRSMSVNIEFSGNVFGDERSISEYVYNGIRTAQHEGVIGEW